MLVRRVRAVPDFDADTRHTLLRTAQGTHALRFNLSSSRDEVQLRVRARLLPSAALRFFTDSEREVPVFIVEDRLQTSVGEIADANRDEPNVLQGLRALIAGQREVRTFGFVGATFTMVRLDARPIRR